MELRPYAGSTAPQTPALRPKLMTWTSRVWRESPGRTIPLFKIDARLEPREVEDNALSQALRPFSSQLQKLTIYLLHPEETPRLAPWAVGRLDIDEKSAYIFFHDYLAAPNGARRDRHRDQSRSHAGGGGPVVVRRLHLRLRHPRPHRLTRCHPGQ
jgi:hypothetical protein